MPNAHLEKSKPKFFMQTVSPLLTILTIYLLVKFSLGFFQFDSLVYLDIAINKYHSLRVLKNISQMSAAK